MFQLTHFLFAASKEEADELHKHFENQEAEDWTFFGFFVPEEWEQGDWFGQELKPGVLNGMLI